jgi:hypothetical protein
MSARRLAWALSLATAGLAAATVAFAVVDNGTRLPADEGGDSSAAGEAMFAVMIVTFGALGALLASRRPRNGVGWLLCLASLALGVNGIARGWYIHTYYGAPGSRPVPEELLWVGNWVWALGFNPLITALLLLFPDGRLPSRRWWPAAALVGAALTALVVGYAFEPGRMDDYPRVRNPLAAPGVAGEAAAFLQVFGYPLFAAAALASAAALISRFRRSRGDERQQLKWIAAAAALAVTAYFVNVALDQALGVNSAFFLPIVLLAIPAAATVAILRYRLYDLGRIVNRTLVYVALTITLGGCYLGLVLLVGLAAGESDVAIAASTLAVAALFRPARGRIQAIVDRRFYRRRYDAARTLETFGVRLREELDLEALGEHLRDAVDESVQPAHVSLWLRR